MNTKNDSNFSKHCPNIAKLTEDQRYKAYNKLSIKLEAALNTVVYNTICHNATNKQLLFWFKYFA